MIPEFVGRLPVLAPLDPLDEEALIRILTEPKNALVRQYQKLFEMEGAELEFELPALQEIARLAKARDTGARGLRAIVEEVMLDVMYDLPDMEHKGKHIITAEVVRGRAQAGREEARQEERVTRRRQHTTARGDLSAGGRVVGRTIKSARPLLVLLLPLPLDVELLLLPPNSAAPFPLSLSPSIVRVYSTVILLSMTFRTAENVSFPSLNFRSLSFSSFWSGQLIVPASLSPSFLIVRVDVRFLSPISYSHFHVPTGSALSSRAPARPHSPSTNAAERIAFMIASEKWRAGCRPTWTASGR